MLIATALGNTCYYATATSTEQRMIALLTCAILYALFFYLARCLANALNIGSVYVWIAYFAISELVETNGWTRCPSLRSSAFVRFIGREFMRCRFTADSLATMAAFSTSAQYMFVCEPHGIACLLLVFGFAAHGDDGLPSSIANRTLVIAHHSYRYIPILRNIYAVFGVIDERPATLKRVLAAGYSVALIPSALSGKWHSMLPRSSEANADRDIGLYPVEIIRRRGVGCFEYARRFGLTIVPVLTPDEDYIYLRYPLAGDFVPLMITAGSWLIRPLISRVEWRIGTPIHTADSRHTRAHDLAAMVYRELQRLGGVTHQVWVRTCNDDIADLARMAWNKGNKTS